MSAKRIIPRRLIAFHEAGHAVARFESGLSIKLITISPNSDGSFLGYNELHSGKRAAHWIWRPAFRNLTSGERARCRRDLLWVMAGPIAEALANPEHDAEGGPGIMIAGPDLKIMKLLLEKLYPEEAARNDGMQRAIVRASLFLARTDIWPQVEALATELLDRRPTLSGKEARAVCEGARPTDPVPVIPAKYGGTRRTRELPKRKGGEK